MQNEKDDLQKQLTSTQDELKKATQEKEKLEKALVEVDNKRQYVQPPTSVTAKTPQELNAPVDGEGCNACTIF